MRKSVIRLFRGIESNRNRLPCQSESCMMNDFKERMSKPTLMVAKSPKTQYPRPPFGLDDLNLTKTPLCKQSKNPAI
jgi:hypothetical protein